jgi:hypothetical protein
MSVRCAHRSPALLHLLIRSYSQTDRRRGRRSCDDVSQELDPEQIDQFTDAVVARAWIKKSRVAPPAARSSDPE